MWTDSKQLELEIEYFLKIPSVQHPGTVDLHVNFAKFSIVDKTYDSIDFSSCNAITVMVRNIVQILLLLPSGALIHLRLQKRGEAKLNLYFLFVIYVALGKLSKISFWLSVRAQGWSLVTKL